LLYRTIKLYPAKRIAISEIEVIHYKTFDVFLNGTKFNIQKNTVLKVFATHSFSKDFLNACKCQALFEVPEF